MHRAYHLRPCAEWLACGGTTATKCLVEIIRTTENVSDLLAARSQMAMSLAFHILFAVAGMAMPLLMVIAEWRHQRTSDAAYLELAQRWAKGTAILFAVGAVSGTVLSFELGLLWPRFMQLAGPLIGMPFSLEGFAFFLEAIFLGLYLYGWKRLSPRVHLLCGAVVALSGLASGIFVVAVNSFMNGPSGLLFEGCANWSLVARTSRKPATAASKNRVRQPKPAIAQPLTPDFRGGEV